MSAPIHQIPPAFSLAGQRVLVSGAAGGIGSATARLCAALGAELVLVDVVDAERIRSVVALDQAALQVRTCDQVRTCNQVRTCDLSQRADVEALARDIGPIDALIDAAGVCPFDDWNDLDWDRSLDQVINVNVRGPINLARAFMPGMVERRSGRMVFCGSLAGWTGGLRSGAHYAFAKGGLHSFVRWLAQRLTPHNVLVNGIAPGTTETQMTQGRGYSTSSYPMNRFATPEEMAAPIAFLCSPGASFIAGTIIDVNGGVYLR